MEAEEDEIDHFYEQLRNVLEAVRKHHYNAHLMW